MTDGHNAPADDPLTAAFHDADLWILSAPQKRVSTPTAPRCARSTRSCDEQAPTAPGAPPSSSRSRSATPSTAPGTPAGSGTQQARVNLSRELTRLRG